MHAHPLDWHLIAIKRFTKTYGPRDPTLRYVVALGAIQGKSYRTQTSDTRNCEDAFHLPRCIRRLDPVWLTGHTRDEGLLRVWARDRTDVIGDPNRWDFVTAKIATETGLPTRLSLRHVIAATTIQSKADRTQ